jgi:uncharacterized membrane protein YdjX (TVP38/TMEM64 family)
VDFSHVLQMAQLQQTTSGANWTPLVILGALIALAYAFGLQNYFSLENIAGHRSVVQDYVSAHLVLSLLIYTAIYIVVVATSLPAASFLSIAGGFVFGWFLSGTITIFAATIGAVIVFQVVKTSLGTVIAARAGPFVKKLSDGFSEDAFNYLLFLRLVPAFPFFAVNAVAGLIRVNLRTFILATLIGIIPGSYAFAWLGGGFGSVIDAQIAAHNACVAKDGFNNCAYKLSASSLITPQLLIAFCILGLVALIPVALKKWKSAK